MALFEEKPNGTSPPPYISTAPRSPPQNSHPSPSNRPHLNGLDRLDSPPPPPEIDSSFNSPQIHSHISTPNSERNPTWSSAVGKATTGGKSGRVIERLMNENDRLLREKKLATVQLEEELKRGDSARSALESLQVSNENLTSMHESDLSLLLKRDRRIQELRDDLKTESTRRENAELSTRDLRLERDETVERMQREGAEDREQSKRATSQYEVLSKSWKGLEDTFERQMKQLKSDIQSLQADIKDDKGKMARLEVIIEQLSKESEKSQKAKDQIFRDFEEYKRAQEDGIRSMREDALLNEEAMNNAQRQMETVLGQMRHVINVKRDVRGAE